MVTGAAAIGAGSPANVLLYLSFGLVRVLDGFEVTRENAEGRLAEIVEQAGFAQVTVTGSMNTVLGTLQYIAAKKN